MSTTKSNKFYITTSIAYANAAPHIGFAMEAVQADVLARYHRLLGDDVFFLSGTDENGSKMKKTAGSAGMETQKFADENSARFQLLLDVLNISNNDFMRTTDKVRHWPVAQKIWQKLVDAGDIYKNNYEGYYCVGCEAYLTEKDLTDGKCPNHQKKPEKIKEENYFFKLSKYSEKIQQKIESDELEILPKGRKIEILNFIKGGLKDISFSRPKNVLDWGIPVPNDESQIMYVWCDALTNYISALGYDNNFKNFKKYWPADIHIIGKDILRFHAAIWPAMLLSADLPLPKKIFVHGFVTSGGQKMSKSLGNVVDPIDVAQKYGVDVLRYYLLKEITSGSDGDFSYEKLEEIYRADLANGIGNLVARVLAMTEKYFDGKIPNKKTSSNSLLDINKKDFKNTWKFIEEKIEKIELDKAIGSIMFLEEKNRGGMIKKLDNLIQKLKPWECVKNDSDLTAVTIYNLLESIRHIAWMIYPFMPETSMKIFEQLFANEKERKIELNKNLKQAQIWGGLKSGTKIKKGEILFPRL